MPRPPPLEIGKTRLQVKVHSGDGSVESSNEVPTPRYQGIWPHLRVTGLSRSRVEVIEAPSLCAPRLFDLDGLESAIAREGAELQRLNVEVAFARDLGCHPCDPLAASTVVPGFQMSVSSLPRFAKVSHPTSWLLKCEFGSCTNVSNRTGSFTRQAYASVCRST